MFARLFSNNTNIQTAYSEISKVITGAITSPASLTAFNTATSIIVTTQPSNWYEYTTVGANNSVTAGTVIWFRQRSKSGVWKYAGLYRTSSPATAHKGILNHYTGDSPSVQATSVGTATNYSAVYGATTEYTIAAGSRYLVIASKLTTDAHFTDVHMWLEYPNNDLITQSTLPDHIMYRHIGTGAVYGVNSSTDLNFPSGIIEYGLDTTFKILRGGMPTGSTQQATMKPGTYTTSVNTVDSLGNFIEYPILPLYTESLYNGFLDCSTLTGVLGAGTGVGNYGDTVTINGIQYIFLKANTSLSYLVPYR